MHRKSIAGAAGILVLGGLGLGWHSLGVDKAGASGPTVLHYGVQANSLIPSPPSIFEASVPAGVTIVGGRIDFTEDTSVMFGEALVNITVGPSPAPACDTGLPANTINAPTASGMHAGPCAQPDLNVLYSCILKGGSANNGTATCPITTPNPGIQIAAGDSVWVTLNSNSPGGHVDAEIQMTLEVQ